MLYKHQLPKEHRFTLSTYFEGFETVSVTVSSAYKWILHLILHDTAILQNTAYCMKLSFLEDENNSFFE